MHYRLLTRYQRAALVLGLMSMAFSPSSVGANPELFLPPGTAISIQPMLSMSGLSQAAAKGAPINFAVKQDVIVDGWVAVPKGSVVRAILTSTAAGDTSTPAPAGGAVATSGGIGGSGGLGAAGGMLSSAATMLSNATFAFQWVQLPAGKVRLDPTPQSVSTALFEFGAGAYSVLSNVLGKVSNQAPASGNSSNELAMHAALTAHTARGVHVPGLNLGPQSNSDGTDYIDR